MSFIITPPWTFPAGFASSGVISWAINTMLSFTRFPFIPFTSTDPAIALVYPWKVAGSSLAFYDSVELENVTFP
jgi:hypothetical protein